MQQWCHANLRDFISSQDWPPNTPGLNPLDFSAWGVLQARACAKPHENVVSLKTALTPEWNKLDADYLRHTVDAFPCCLRECIKAKGDRIENEK
ncbi:hypothetical protein ANCCAN_00691 [Ancylostoma caninum]|uniref:Uncharacterized protein n=1 Tax=Ancylostoma caninum TaxID=29170 RepID=A0A368HBR3_ANCCA|nr:hypothetical protein ANCCAN_00691 [Ancylostoma caninum]